MMLNHIGMKCSLKNFSKIVLVLISQHNVHQAHIIQVLLIMILMVFEEKRAKCDLLILLRKLFKIVLHQHETQHNLMKYEIVIYNYSVHVFMHIIIGNSNESVKILHDLNKYGIICHAPVMMYIQQLNLILFERNIHYNVKVLKKKKIVQSMRGSGSDPMLDDCVVISNGDDLLVYVNQVIVAIVSDLNRTASNRRLVFIIMTIIKLLIMCMCSCANSN